MVKKYVKIKSMVQEHGQKVCQSQKVWYKSMVKKYVKIKSMVQLGMSLSFKAADRLSKELLLHARDA